MIPVVTGGNATSYILNNNSHFLHNDIQPNNMLNQSEVRSATQFFSKNLLHNDFNDHHAEAFKNALLKCLTQRFFGHWHPESPEKGSAFRCVSVQNGHLDPVLRDAARIAGVEDSIIVKALPPNFSLWIDPGEVSVRIGDKSRIWSVDQMINVSSSDSDSGGSESDDGAFPGTRKQNNRALNPTSKVWMPSTA